jgi:hypothetical protein
MECCSRITRELIEHPLASIFVEPTTTLQGEPLRFLMDVRHPMDLSTVLAKLRNHEYANSKDWESDINLIFKNCLSSHGSCHIASKLALFVQSRFEKLKKQLQLTSYDGWVARCRSLQRKLGVLLTQQSGRVRSPSPEPATRNEILAGKLSQIEDRASIIEVVRVLTEYGVPVKWKAKVLALNVDELPPETLDALKMLLTELPMREE